MPSLQSKLLKIFIRWGDLFGGDEVDPYILRARVERSARRMRTHPRVKVTPEIAGGVPSEWLVPLGAPADRALLYIHGGAWFMGSAATHRGLVSRIAYAGGVRALSINYRLAPEHPFPAGLEDCIAVYEWLLRSGIDPGKIVVAGDSAGGNLTLALLLTLRDAGKSLPAGAAVLSPATDLTMSGKSRRTRAHLDPFFSTMGSNSIIPNYIGDYDPRHPYISPLFASLRGLPRLLLHVGEHEILYDDVVSFGECARAAGVDATTVVWPGMFHVFQIFAAVLPEARLAVAQIAGFLQESMAQSRSA